MKSKFIAIKVNGILIKIMSDEEKKALYAVHVPVVDAADIKIAYNISSRTLARYKKAGYIKSLYYLNRKQYFDALEVHNFFCKSQPRKR